MYISKIENKKICLSEAYLKSPRLGQLHEVSRNLLIRLSKVVSNARKLTYERCKLLGLPDHNVNPKSLHRPDVRPQCASHNEALVIRLF